MSTYKVKYLMLVSAAGEVEIEADSVGEAQGIVEEMDRDELEKEAINNGALTSEVSVIELSKVLLKKEAS